MMNILYTDSNTASKRCSIHPAWSLITPDYKYLQHHRRNQYNNIVNKSNNTHLHSIYYIYYNVLNSYVSNICYIRV